ncbi:MAG: T9SS C-terminal target domain-containing protein [Balneola sp.]|nr:MAG: T9SS C-terminal target domain-containing protein [Balneola sp.]
MKRSYYLLLVLFLSSSPLLAQVDYEESIQTIFTAQCNSCHNVGQNTFNSSSYTAVMASTSAADKYNQRHVIPGDEDGSPLVDKIEANPQHGARMPINGELTSDQINLIRQWISEGANEVATNSEEEIGLPDEFKLVGNFPNPFNPGTQIEFDVPVSSQYTISIYSVHGRLISELVGTVSPGRAQIAVNLSNAPTGIYLYRVTALANGSSTLIGIGRMTLIK